LIWRINQYLLHRWRAQGKSSLRSPFVLDFYEQVLKAVSTKETNATAAFARSLRKDKTTIQRKDFGAGHGGKGGGSYPSSIAETARRSSRRHGEGRLLYAMVKHYQPQRMLELGSHLGISTLYQAQAMPTEGQCISLEGDPTLARLAQKHLDTFNLKNVRIVEGAFAATLPDLGLAEFRPDYVFLDGDHRYEPVLQYVAAILPHMPPQSILILDDIYWSKGMARAWKALCAMEECTITIDLFYFGICFVRMPEAKAHFVF
jgi:predicted O-methyltransferase YrrM